MSKSLLSFSLVALLSYSSISYSAIVDAPMVLVVSAAAGAGSTVILTTHKEDRSMSILLTLGVVILDKKSNVATLNLKNDEQFRLSGLGDSEINAIKNEQDKILAALEEMQLNPENKDALKDNLTPEAYTGLIKLLQKHR